MGALQRLTHHFSSVHAAAIRSSGTVEAHVVEEQEKVKRSPPLFSKRKAWRFNSLYPLEAFAISPFLLQKEGDREPQYRTRVEVF